MNIIEEGINQFKPDPENLSSGRDSTKSFIPHQYVNKITIIFFSISLVLFSITNILFHLYFNDIEIEMGEDATIYYQDDQDSVDKGKDLEFVYINDIHLDPLYIASSSPSSFCRKFDERFVNRPFYFGQYKCDLPFSTLHSMLRYINSKIYPKKFLPQNPRRSKPNFVLLGGDTVAHFLPYSMEQSHSFISEVVNNISISFNHKYNNNDDKVPILFVLGNNEYVPNYGSCNFSFDKQNFESLYEHVIGPHIIKDRNYIKDDNEKYNPKDIKQIEHDNYVKEQKRTFKRGGYYYYDIPEAKLRLLVMNTVTYSHWRDIDAYNNRKISYDEDIDIKDQYDYLSEDEIDFLRELKKHSKSNKISNDDEGNDNYIDPKDPYGQFEWILESSRDAINNHNYTVGIALHIPPGIFFTDGNYSRISQGWKTSFIQRFDTVITEANIEFIISAHSHFDLFLPINGPNSTSKLFSISAPALSPNHWNNPGFRIFKLSNEGKLLDYEQYYANIINNPQPRFKHDTNSKGTGLSWKLDYTFKEAYGTKVFQKEPQENDDSNDEFDDVSDFEQYNNFTSDSNDTYQSTNKTKINPQFEIIFQPKGPKEITGINKETLQRVIEWVSSTTEGRWAFKQRSMTHGEENGVFNNCLHTCTTVEQVFKCLGPLAPKIMPKQ